MKIIDFLKNRNFCISTATAALIISVCGSFCQAAPSKNVLIVMDEREQMEVLADIMKEKGGITSTIVDQAGLPDDLSSYDAIIGYIHDKVEKNAELAIIDYTKKGGRFVCLHHSISSKKVVNPQYLDFLGIRLDGLEDRKNPTTHGGHYAYRNPAELTIVKLNSNHFITNNNINWDERISYIPSEQPSIEKEFPAFTIKRAEFFLNHKFTDGRDKTVLLGFKCRDDRNGIVFMQDRAGWIKKQGKGHIIYLKMGHYVEEFKNPNVSQLCINAILWSPETD